MEGASQDHMAPDQQELAQLDESSGAPTTSYYRKTPVKNRGFIRGPLDNRRRRIIVSLSVLAAAIVSAIIISFTLLPLKILLTVHNLQDHFFASTNSAVTREVDNMTSGYVKKYVMPGLKKCGGGTVKSTIDKTCTPIAVTGTSVVSNMYKAWRTAKFENLLAEKGIEFKYNSKSGRYYVKSPALSKDVDVTDFANNKVANLTDSEGWREVSKKEFSEFGSDLHNNIEDITRFEKVMYRFKMTGILHKYGATRCIIACDKRRALSDSLANRKRAAQIKIAQRVIAPQSQELALIIQCVIAGCDVTPGSGTPGLNGEPRSAAEVELENTLARLAAQEGTEATLDAVAQATKDINEKGWTRYAMGEVFAQLVGKLGGDEAAQQSARELAEGVVGPVGWAILAAQIIDGLNKAGPVVKELGYDMNAAAYAKTYLTLRTYADEMRDPTAAKDAVTVQSFNEILGPGSHDGFNSGEKQLGGTAEAEQTPLYQTIISHDKVGSNKYICQNGQPVPQGQLVCDEEKIGQGNKYLDNLHNFLNLPGLNVLTKMAGIINGTISKVLIKLVGPFASALSFIAEHTPGVSDAWNQLQAYAKGILTPLLQSLVSKLIDVPVSSVMSGGRVFDAAAGGADIVGNDFAHHQLGGVMLTDQQVLADLNQQAQEDMLQYKNEPLLTRAFDTNSKYSLVNRMALAMPSSASSGMNSLSSIFTKPLGSLAAGFSSILQPSRVFAAATTSGDPFGITQYGYPADDPIFNSDAENYWDQHCTDSHMTDAWNKASLSNINDANLQPENPQQPIQGLADSDPKGTNPCMLILTAVGSAGALYDSSLLTSDDLGGSANTQGNGNTTPPGGIGSTTKITFPLRTTQSVIKTGVEGAVWCYTSLTNCHHDYNAADLHAPTGTQTVSPADCTVMTVHDTIDPQWVSPEGSRTSLKCSDGRTYYMAHMGKGTLVIRVGQHLRPGDPVGKVGTDADAEGTPAHLHIDALPASQYDSRPNCSDAACQAFPFINLQPDLVSAFGQLPQ